MKPKLLLAVFWMLLGGFAMSASATAQLAKPATYADAKASFKILAATWGAKYKGAKDGRHTDVSERATDLLVHRGWLKVNPQDLQSDPWPGKLKFLNVLYEVLGKTARLVVHENSGLTLHRLIKHAGVLPADSHDDPPATKEGEDKVKADDVNATAASAMKPVVMGADDQ